LNDGGFNEILCWNPLGTPCPCVCSGCGGCGGCIVPKLGGLEGTCSSFLGFVDLLSVFSADCPPAFSSLGNFFSAGRSLGAGVAFGNLGFVLGADEVAGVLVVGWFISFGSGPLVGVAGFEPAPCVPGSFTGGILGSSDFLEGGNGGNSSGSFGDRLGGSG
jgi:hypothetical protein